MAQADTYLAYLELSFELDGTVGRSRLHPGVDVVARLLAAVGGEAEFDMIGVVGAVVDPDGLCSGKGDGEALLFLGREDVDDALLPGCHFGKGHGAGIIEGAHHVDGLAYGLKLGIGLLELGSGARTTVSAGGGCDSVAVAGESHHVAGILAVFVGHTLVVFGGVVGGRHAGGEGVAEII